VTSKDPATIFKATTPLVVLHPSRLNTIKMSKGKFWVTEPDQEIVPRIDEKGYGARPPVTIVEAFRSTVAKHGDCNALASQTKVDVSVLI
jgi:hypothetical protein